MLIGPSVHGASTGREAAARRYEDPAWRLVWQDEFDGAGAPEPARWTYVADNPDVGTVWFDCVGVANKYLGPLPVTTR